MSSKPSTVCPDAETLAACAEGRLAGDERQAVLRHVLECADCDIVFTDTLRLLDEDDARGVPPAVGAPGATAAPGDPRADDPDAPGGARLLRFEARRWRRAAAVALPVAAGALFALSLLQRPGPIEPTPITVASAPSPTPAPARPAVELLDLEVLRSGALPDIRQPATGFGGRPTGARLCRFLGVRLVDVEVRARSEPTQAESELDNLAPLAEPLGAQAQYEGARGRLRSERRLPAADELRPRAGCDGPDYDAARAVAWVRLAVLGRNLLLLEHDDVARGLEAGARLAGEDGKGVREIARRVETCRREPGACDWQGLGLWADALVGGWH